MAGLDDEPKSTLLKSYRFDALTEKTITSAERMKSELEQIETLGYGLDDEESNKGVRCVAAPVPRQSWSRNRGNFNIGRYFRILRSGVASPG